MKEIKRVSKVVGVSIILLILFSTASGLQVSTNKLEEINSDMNNSALQLVKASTHTVFAEACTASWCPPCATASAAMNEIFYSGDYDFYYVSLVLDKNSYANARCNELDVQYIPDYVFDGGYTRHVGSIGLPSAYITRIVNSGRRDVADIDLDLAITWKGNADIDIDLNIKNNEASTYNGHLHVYVTEIESRWNTNSGDPYHFAMIGKYAFNENINIDTGATSEFSTTWEGSKYGLSDLKEDNIMVIATVYNSENKNYIDETTAASFAELWPPDLELKINGGLSAIRANIKNIGTVDMEDIDWSINVEGGALDLISLANDGTISELEVDEEKTLQTNKPIFGLGRITITINVNIGTVIEKALVLGPLIIII